MELNEKVMRLAAVADDAKLAVLAWETSEAEEKRGVLLGPYPSPQDAPVTDPSLCWRKAVWELRGEETEPDGRLIDDMLACGRTPQQPRSLPTSP